MYWMAIYEFDLINDARELRVLSRYDLYVYDEGASRSCPNGHYVVP